VESYLVGLFIRSTKWKETMHKLIWAGLDRMRCEWSVIQNSTMSRRSVTICYQSNLPSFLAFISWSFLTTDPTFIIDIGYITLSDPIF
jgi:hypothetical protein